MNSKHASFKLYSYTVLELPSTTDMPTQGSSTFFLLNQICSTSFTHVGIIDQSVTFQLTSSLDSIDVTFSLICNSTGGSVTSFIWKRDGFLLDNTDPLVVTDNSTASYVNVLHVSSRTTGAYTCLVWGPSDELLNSITFDVQGNNYDDF